MAELGAILARLAPSLGPAVAPPRALDGGITNRNFRVRLGEREYVVRLPGTDTALLGIDRAAELAASRMAARLGIAPEVAAADPEGLVTVFAGAGPLDPDRLRADPAPVARALRAFHDSGLQLPVRFWVPDLLDRYARVVRDRGADLPAAYAPTRRLAGRIAAALPLSEPVPCHDDLLGGNLLATPDGVLIVDWEYAGMGHRLFDLGNLAVNNEFDEPAEARLLAAYFDAPPTPARTAALRLMRIMSDAREAAWGVIQGVVSELDYDFAAYARRHFERLAATAADPRLEGWLDAAAA